jgi:predicted alpha/beta-hydrolase family hydrolase
MTHEATDYAIPSGLADIDVGICIDGDISRLPLLVLAHGAGAPMDSEFMNRITELLLERGIAVARFEFPYMVERRLHGKKRPPNQQKVLLACWCSVVQRLRKLMLQLDSTQLLFIGGKSMGGRMASLIADECAIKGLVCLGYPFHPAGKPEKTRTEHLRSLKTPSLIVQGTRDKLGNVSDVAGYDLSDNIKMFWLEDGDHDFKPRVKSGLTQAQHMQATAETIKQFVAIG